MQFPIIIGLHRSRLIGRALLLTALVASGLPLVYISDQALLLLVFIATFLTTFKAWKALSPSVHKLYLERSGQIRVSLNEGGSIIPACCLPGATIHPWLTAFRLQIEDGESLTVIATADCLSPDEFRQLRAFFRWRANFNVMRGTSS